MAMLHPHPLPSKPAPDALRALQYAAHQAAAHVSPATVAGRVIVLDADGAKVVELRVPPRAELPDPGPTTEVMTSGYSWAGWQIDDRRALYNGRLMPVSRSRLLLLGILAVADVPMTAQELTDLVFDRHTATQTTRYHIRKLRAELREAFPAGDGPTIIGGDQGYRMVFPEGDAGEVEWGDEQETAEELVGKPR